jgi:hypothetical protein
MFTPSYTPMPDNLFDAIRTVWCLITNDRIVPDPDQRSISYGAHFAIAEGLENGTVLPKHDGNRFHLKYPKNEKGV